MKIYLVRHGIAQERLGGGVTTDAQRPLTDEGRTETKHVAQALERLGAKGELIVSSPLVRAKQTAEIINDVIGPRGSEVRICDALAPGGSATALFKFIAQFKHANEVFCVGHEPDMGMLGATLLWAGRDMEIPFKKAGVLRIDVSDIPPTAPGTLKWFMPPKIATLVAGK